LRIRKILKKVSGVNAGQPGEDLLQPGEDLFFAIHFQWRFYFFNLPGNFGSQNLNFHRLGEPNQIPGITGVSRSGPEK
jgi:hypothetical protein